MDMVGYGIGYFNPSYCRVFLRYVVLCCCGVGVFLRCVVVLLGWRWRPWSPCSRTHAGEASPKRGTAPGAEAVDVMHVSGSSFAAQTLTERLAVLVLVSSGLLSLALRALDSRAVDSESELCNSASSKHQQHDTTLPPTDDSQCRAGPAPVCRSHGSPPVCAIAPMSCPLYAN